MDLYRHVLALRRPSRSRRRRCEESEQTRHQHRSPGELTEAMEAGRKSVADLRELLSDLRQRKVDVDEDRGTHTQDQKKGENRQREPTTRRRPGGLRE